MLSNLPSGQIKGGWDPVFYTECALFFCIIDVFFVKNDRYQYIGIIIVVI